MSVSHINYRENYFQHPLLTKIHGDPTYGTLANKLEKECKANSKSLSPTLADGGLQGESRKPCSHQQRCCLVCWYLPSSRRSCLQFLPYSSRATSRARRGNAVPNRRSPSDFCSWPCLLQRVQLHWRHHTSKNIYRHQWRLPNQPHPQRHLPSQRNCPGDNPRIIWHLLSHPSPVAHPQIPITKWDLLMPQALITLNLLRSSHCQPRLSAYDACLNHNFRSARHWSCRPRHAQAMRQHGTSPCQRMLCWALNWTLPLPQILYTKHVWSQRCPHHRLVPSQHPFPKVTTVKYLHQMAADMLNLIQEDKVTNPIPALTYTSNITNAYIQIA